MAWTTVGSLKGPQGVQGPTGQQGIQGLQGPPGEDGAGIEVAGGVDTYQDLPTNLGPSDAGKGYLNRADGRLYIWDGTQFPAEGEGVQFRGERGLQGEQGVEGPEGPQGVQGAQGDRGDQGPQGDQGIQGVQGVKGDKGDQGDQGVQGVRGTKWYSGTGAPGTISGSMPGDYYLDSATGDFYVLS